MLYAILLVITYEIDKFNMTIQQNHIYPPKIKSLKITNLNQRENHNSQKKILANPTMTPRPTFYEYYYVDKEFYVDLPIHNNYQIDSHFKQISGCKFNNITSYRNYMIQILDDIPFYDNTFQFDEIYTDKACPIWVNYHGNFKIQNCTFINCQHNTRGNIDDGNVININRNTIINITIENCEFINCGNIKNMSVVSVFNTYSSLYMMNCTFTFDDGTLSPFTCKSKCLINCFDQCHFKKCGKILIYENNDESFLQFTNNIVEYMRQPFIETDTITTINFTGNFFSDVKHNDENSYFFNISSLEKIELNDNVFTKFSTLINSRCNIGCISFIFLIKNDENSTLIFRNCSFIENVIRSPNSQGGINSFDVSYQLIMFDECKFTSNRNPFGKGGAISLFSSQNIDIASTEFINNKSSEEGGAIFIYSHPNNDLNKITFYNSQFIFNKGTNGTAIFIQEDENTSNLTVDIMNNYFQSNDEGDTKYMIYAKCKEFNFKSTIVLYSNVNKSTGALFITNAELIDINHNDFSNCRANDGVIKINEPKENAITYIYNCEFDNCISSIENSYIIKIFGGISYIHLCTFSFHSSELSCGGIDFGPEGFTISKCKFIRTKSLGAIKCIQIYDSLTPISIDSCIFDECYGMNKRCFDLFITSSLIFQNNVIQNMIETGYYGYFGAIDTFDIINNIVLENITFINNRCNSEFCGGTGFWITGTDKITFNECNFINNTVLKSNSPRHIYPIGQDEYYAGDGGAIQYGFSNSISGIDLIFIRCFFSQNKAVRHGGAIAIQTQKEVEIINCTFEENVANYQQLSSFELLYENHFYKKIEGRGGALYINPSFTTNQGSFYLKGIIIEGCTFKSNKAYDGYAIYIEADYAETTIEIKNNKFIDNFDEEIHSINKSVITSEITSVISSVVIESNYFDFPSTSDYVPLFLYVDHYGIPITQSSSPSVSPTLSPIFECLQEIEHCIECSSPTQCKACEDGYGLNNMKKCEQCPIECATCDFFPRYDEIMCKSCANGYYISMDLIGSDPGFIICNSCNNDYQSGCLNCTEYDSCIECDKNYYKNGKSCSKCSDNCLTCLNHADYCLTCYDGYFLDDFSMNCIKCTNNCIKCMSLNKCEECEDGYVLYENMCINRIETETDTESFYSSKIETQSDESSSIEIESEESSPTETQSYNFNESESQTEEPSETSIEYEESNIITTISEDSSTTDIQDENSSIIETQSEQLSKTYLQSDSSSGEEIQSDKSSENFLETEQLTSGCINESDESSTGIVHTSSFKEISSKFAISNDFTASFDLNKIDIGSQLTNQPNKKISKGALIAVIAVIAAVLIAAVVIVLFIKMRKRQDSKNENTNENRETKVSTQEQIDTSAMIKNYDSSENDINFWI